MIEIPDQEEPIVLTRKKYPNLPFNEVIIENPRKLREGLGRYCEYMLEKYKKGELKFIKN